MTVTQVTTVVSAGLTYEEKVDVDISEGEGVFVK